MWHILQRQGKTEILSGFQKCLTAQTKLKSYYFFNALIFLKAFQEAKMAYHLITADLLKVSALKNRSTADY